MSSQDQVYEKTMAGFLAALDRIGAPQESRSSAEHSPPDQLQTGQPLSEHEMSEHETQLLEDAVADIEQTMRRRSYLRASSR